MHTDIIFKSLNGTMAIINAIMSSNCKTVWKWSWREIQQSHPVLWQTCTAGNWEYFEPEKWDLLIRSSHAFLWKKKSLERNSEFECVTEWAAAKLPTAFCSPINQAGLDTPICLEFMVTEFVAWAVPAWASKFGPAEKQKIRKFAEVR